MNIFNNIKAADKDDPRIHRMDIYDQDKRVAIGLTVKNKTGRIVLETYPKRVEKYGIVYVTTKWNNKREKIYTNQYLNAREIGKLINELLNQ